MNGEVIKTAENAFLCNAQNTCEKTVGKVGIVFKRAGKQITHKTDNLFVVSGSVTLLDRCVVFINDDYSRLSVVFVKHA